jgi:hypothetical protein
MTLTSRALAGALEVDEVLDVDGLPHAAPRSRVALLAVWAPAVVAVGRVPAGPGRGARLWMRTLIGRVWPDDGMAWEPVNREPTCRPLYCWASHDGVESGGSVIFGQLLRGSCPLRCVDRHHIGVVLDRPVTIPGPRIRHISAVHPRRAGLAASVVNVAAVFKPGSDTLAVSVLGSHLRPHGLGGRRVDLGRDEAAHEEEAVAGVGLQSAWTLKSF